MAITFPASLDNFTNPQSVSSVANPSHSQQHSDANDAIEALQTKIGVNNSTVPTTIDYRVKTLELGIAKRIQTLSAAPSFPDIGAVYFDIFENTIKVYNGVVWYDVAGPKSILEHDHEINGLVNSVDYGNYVSEDKIFANAGSTSSTYIDNYIDGGGA
jgi:hypothetical protein